MGSPIHLRVILAMLLATTYIGSYGPSSWGAIELEFTFTAELTSVNDTYGLFGAIAPGDSVNGRVRYGGTIPDGSGDDQIWSRELSVLPGGDNAMSIGIGSLLLAATQQMSIQNYNDTFSDIYGFEVYFSDADAAVLNTSLLPSDLQASLVGGYFGLFSTDAGLWEFPNLPSDLQSLSAYDSSFTGGFAIVQIRDMDFNFIESAVAGYRLTSITVVPEPSIAGWATLTSLSLLSYQRNRSKRPIRLVRDS